MRKQKCGSLRRRDSVSPAKRLKYKAGRVSVLKKASKKHGKIVREYLTVRKEYLRQHPLCTIELPGCTRLATQIHHSGKKFSEKLWLDTSLFVSCCDNCHREIERSPLLAKELGIYNYKL